MRGTFSLAAAAMGGAVFMLTMTAVIAQEVPADEISTTPAQPAEAPAAAPEPAAGEPGFLSWHKTFRADAEDGYEALFAAAADPGGGYVAVGTAQRPRSMGRFRVDAWILSLDAQGETRWQKLLGGKKGEQFFTVSTGPDGTILAAGGTGSMGAGGADGYFVLFDRTGAILKEVTHGGEKGDSFADSVPHPDGGFVMAGHTEASSDFFGDRAKGWVVRTDAMGKALWTQSFSDWKYTVLKGVALLPDGGIVAVGSTGQSREANSGWGWMVRLDAQGGKVWHRKLERKHQHDLRDVVALPDGGFIAVGATHPVALWERAQGLVIRFDAQGAVLWERTIGKGYAEAAAIEARKDGSVVVAATLGRIYEVGRVPVGLGAVVGFSPDGTELFRRGIVKHTVFRAVVPAADGTGAAFGLISERPERGRRHLSGFGGTLTLKPVPEGAPEH